MKAAEFLAKGVPVGIVADEIGCSRQSLYRAIKCSPGLRKVIEKEQDRLRVEAGMYLKGMRQKVAQKMFNLAMEGNIKALSYLADKLDITQGNYNWHKHL